MNHRYPPRLWHGPALVGKFVIPLIVGLFIGAFVATSPDASSAMFRIVFLVPALVVGVYLLFIPGQLRLDRGKLKYRKWFTWRTIPVDQVASLGSAFWFPAINLRNGHKLRYFAEAENRGLTAEDLRDARANPDATAGGAIREDPPVVYDAVLVTSGVLVGAAVALLSLRFPLSPLRTESPLIAALVVTGAAVGLSLRRLKRGWRWLFSFVLGTFVSAPILDAVMTARVRPVRVSVTETGPLLGGFMLCCAALLGGIVCLISPGTAILVLAKLGRVIDTEAAPTRRRHTQLRVVGGLLVLTGLLLGSIVFSALRD